MGHCGERLARAELTRYAAVGSEDSSAMTGPQLRPWQDPDQTPDRSVQSPAASAAITLVPNSPVPSVSYALGWGRWLAIAAGLTALGGFSWVVWWFFLRTPLRPYVLDFASENSGYTVTEQATPALNWRISHPEQVETMVVRAFDAEGTLVGVPEEHDLTGPLPVGLLPHCTETKQELICQGVPTTLRQPGQYTFQLSLLPRASLNLPPVEATSSLVTITAMPPPTVVELVPQQVVYSEAGTQVSANTPELAPPVTQAGILVSWMVSDPDALQDLLLIVKQADGAAIGGRRFTFRDPEAPGNIAVPQELQPFCRLDQTLICQGVPTGMTRVGKYKFELTAVPVGLEEEGVIPEATISEVVEIKPRPVNIAYFTVNGQEAEPRYLIPVDQGQPIPGFHLGWQVEGGSTARVELLPSPGSVGLQGTLPLPLSPEPGTTTVTLRVSDGQNPPILRAVTFETFDPTPNSPVVGSPNRAPVSAANNTPSAASAGASLPSNPLGELLRQEAQSQSETDSDGDASTILQGAPDPSRDNLNLGF